MKVAIMQPYIFPYLGYFQLVNLVDKFVFFDDVSFIKGGWINRNNLLIENKSSLFSIPCVNISSNKKIDEVPIDNSKNWKEKLLKKIEHAYKKAPEYDIVFPIIKRVINSKFEFISDLAKRSIKEIATYLEIKTKLIESSKAYNNHSMKGEKRIIDICKKEKAQEYINPEMGLSLYSKENFEKEGLSINFIKFKPTKYQQFSGDFTSYLSIIDILMFNSKKKAKEMLNDFYLL